MKNTAFKKNILIFGLIILAFPSVTFAATQSVLTTLFEATIPIIITLALLHFAQKTAKSLASGITAAGVSAVGAAMKIGAGVVGLGGSALVSKGMSRIVGGAGQVASGASRLAEKYGGTTAVGRSLARGGDRVTSNNRKFRSSKWADPRSNPAAQWAAKKTGMDGFVGSDIYQKKSSREIYQDYTKKRAENKVENARATAAAPERADIQQMNDTERNNKGLQDKNRKINEATEDLKQDKQKLKDLKEAGIDKNDPDYQAVLSSIKGSRSKISTLKGERKKIKMTPKDLGSLGGKKVEFANKLPTKAQKEKHAQEMKDYLASKGRDATYLQMEKDHANMNTSEDFKTKVENMKRYGDTNSDEYNEALRSATDKKTYEKREIKTYEDLEKYKKQQTAIANEKEDIKVEEVATKWEERKKNANRAQRICDPRNWGRGGQRGSFEDRREFAEGLRSRGTESKKDSKSGKDSKSKK